MVQSLTPEEIEEERALEIEKKRLQWKNFQFDPRVWCMSAEQKLKLPDRSDRLKPVAEVHRLAVELHKLLTGNSTLIDMQMSELGLSTADKREKFTPLCMEDWWSLHQSLERVHGSDNPQDGFDPDRVGPTFLQGLICVAVGAALVAAELEASKKKGDRPIPMWRTDLVMIIAWLAECEGIKVTSGENSPFMQIVEVVYRCTNVPVTAKTDVVAYIKMQSNSRALKGKKTGL
jgi:hypothetical protein